MSDLQILRRHVDDRDPRAFEQLVARHLDWVYSSALRQVRDPHTADDVTQAVFLALSRHAGRLAEGVVLSAWLFRATRRASAMALRSAGRRRKHERLAAAMVNEARDTMDEQTWERLAPLLDEMVERLGETDRRSILLRYYQRKSFAEIGDALAIGEAAARKRVSRAVEKLRALVNGRGMTVTAAALAAGLTNYSTQSAPASTAAVVAATVAAPTAASPAVCALTRETMNMMRWTTGTIGAGVGLLVLCAIGLSIAIAQVAGSGKSDAAANAAATRPAAPADAAAATPKGVVVAAYRAALAGDENAMVATFAGLTAGQETTVRRTVRVMAAANELQNAIVATFGANAAKQFGVPGVNVDPLDVFDAPETITGDRAIVDMGPSGPGQVPLERVGNVWKISAGVLQTLNAGVVTQLEQKAPAIRKLAADVKAGKYATPQDLQRAMGALAR